jgi:large subunit ribosomal protein L14
MIQKNTVLPVIDNSGAQRARCIHVYDGYRKRYANIGDLILVSLISVRKKEATFNQKKQGKQELTKGMVCKAVVVRTKKGTFLRNGKHVSFKQHGIVLLNNKNKYHATRVFGVIPHFLRYTKFLRLTTMASGVIK